MSNSRRPLLIVVSAPSGAGKTTLCDRLLAERADVAYSISCTTRAPRGAERDGVDYFFLTESEFEDRVARGLFLEHARVHGHRYGTQRETVVAALSGGRSVLMDIDVQGAAQIRAAVRRADPGDPIRDGFLDVFIAPPSLEILRERLEKRGEDAPDVIERRIRNAEAEMARQSEFGRTVVNDDLEQAYVRFRSVIEDAEMQQANQTKQRRGHGDGGFLNRRQRR